MRLPAETIYNALFNTVCGINAPQPNGQPSLTPLVTMSRRWVKWDQIGDIPLPGLFQMQPPEGIGVSEKRQFGPKRYVLHAAIFIYLPVDSGNLNTPSSPQLNAYFKAIDDILGPTIQSPGGARQQLGLGPAIEEAAIDGNVIYDEGLVAPPAMLIFPITIICG